MSRETEVRTILNKKEEEIGPVFNNDLIDTECLKQIAISLAEIVDILRKMEKK